MAVQTRLIALDLDGTALTSSRLPHPELLEAFEKARELGVEICLASGRNMHSLRRVAPLFRTDCHYVSANGCFVQTANGESLLAARISPEALEIVVDYSVETGTYIHAESPAQMVALRGGPELDLYVSRAKIPVEPVGPVALKQCELTHILLIDDADQMFHHHQALEARLNGHADMIFSERDYLEILPKGVSKASGLTVICEHLGILQTETAGIGDFLNDLPMLNWVAFSAAVDNAHPTVREQVDKVFSSNDEGGAAEFVNWIVYNLRKGYE